MSSHQPNIVNKISMMDGNTNILVLVDPVVCHKALQTPGEDVMDNIVSEEPQIRIAVSCHKLCTMNNTDLSTMLVGVVYEGVALCA